MSGTRRVTGTSDAVDVVALGARMRGGAARTARSVGALRFPELVLFFLLPAIEVLPLPGIGFPWDNLVLAAIIALGLTRRPPSPLGDRWPVVPVLALGLFYVAVVSLFADPSEGAASWETRLLRLTAVGLMVLVIGTGRIHVPSAVAGMASALLVNIPLFYAGLVPATYGEYLTGLVGDKNVAGFAYALVGILMLALVRSRTRQVLAVAAFGAGVWLSGSRTAIAAYVAGLVWVLVAPHLPVVGRWLLALVTGFAVDAVSEDFSRIGTFSDREGSDQLRARIDASSEIKVDDAGFLGSGLGEAFVELDGDTWFFHNSYWSALVEGGWPWLLVVLGLTVLVMGRPFRRHLSFARTVDQAACVVILVCAWRLGEVFFTSYWGLAMGIALLAAGAATRDGDPAPADGPSDTVRPVAGATGLPGPGRLA